MRISEVFYFSFFCNDKTLTGRERVDFISQLPGHNPSLREVGAETWRQTCSRDHGEILFIGLRPWFAQLHFLYSSGQLAQELGITYSVLYLHTTNPNQENTPQASMMETISQEFAEEKTKTKTSQHRK